MGVFPFIIAILVLGPIAKAIAERISRGTPQIPDEAELRKALRESEQRQAETESRLAAVEERLDFYEKLLANPNRPTGDQPRQPPDRPA
ncbi:MAG: hypothetical protein ACREMA_01100 [Longimicrobiales bacterium]